MSQNNQILQHLKSGKSITATQAIRLFSCYRLAARISDLRHKGHAIEAIMQKRDRKVWAQYRLGDKK